MAEATVPGKAAAAAGKTVHDAAEKVAEQTDPQTTTYVAARTDEEREHLEETMKPILSAGLNFLQKARPVAIGVGLAALAPEAAVVIGGAVGAHKIYEMTDRALARHYAAQAEGTSTET